MNDNIFQCTNKIIDYERYIERLKIEFESEKSHYELDLLDYDNKNKYHHECQEKINKRLNENREKALQFSKELTNQDYYDRFSKQENLRILHLKIDSDESLLRCNEDNHFRRNKDLEIVKERFKITEKEFNAKIECFINGANQYRHLITKIEDSKSTR